MQKQTYSCGNTPQPGDVVEMVQKEDTVISVLSDGYLLTKYNGWDHKPPHFRLLRRAGEPERGWTINGQQPQPDRSELQPAIKLRLHLEAEKDIPKTNWKKGDRLELENNVFDKNTGIAFIPLDLGWKVNGVEILESDPQPDYAKLLEEKDEAIRELVADLEQLNYWVNSENTKNLITKYKQP